MPPRSRSALPPRNRRHWLSALFCLVCAGPALVGPATAAEFRVAAASDLRFAMPELAELHRTRTGDRARVSFGSSGNLSRQLQQGAPFDLFFSADRAFAQRLVSAGLTLDPGREYGRGRLVLFVAGGSPLAEAMARDEELRALLTDPRLRRLALANPIHAPYGMAAESVLQTLGLLDALQDRLVFGENAAQATRFAVSGNVDAGLVPHATVLAPRVAAAGRYRLVDADLHPPLRQWVVPMRRASKAALDFYRALDDSEYQAVLRRYGLR